jgi:hypothetical protein
VTARQAGDKFQLSKHTGRWLAGEKAYSDMTLVNEVIHGRWCVSIGEIGYEVTDISPFITVVKMITFSSLIKFHSNSHPLSQKSIMYHNYDWHWPNG